MSDFRFPIDCPLECKYHKAWDLSVDDWTHVCTKLNIQIDEYDCGFTGLLPICPIESYQNHSRKKVNRMNDKERKSCIRTIEFLRGLAFNIHGVMDVIDDQNCDKIIEMLNKPEPHWIPCSERLPEDKDYDETFSVTIQCEHVDGWDDYVTGYADWTPHGWDIQSYYLGRIKVTAWMPLPSPYQPKEETE